MSRRPHPYFGQLNRLAEACVGTPGDGNGCAPSMSPREQEGVLWQAFREASEPI